ncbi:MAG TPA: GAF domain-containing protein [Longilinea sp.]|nr:GAF domain-containing protein [Longilinea sp.]
MRLTPTQINLRSSAPKSTEMDLLTTIRTRILRILLYSSTIIGSFLFFFQASVSLRAGDVVQLVVYGVVYAWVLFITFATKLSYSIRVYSLLFIIYILALFTLLQSGLTGTGLVYFISFNILMFAFTSRQSGTVGIFLSAFTVAAVAFLMLNHIVATPSLVNQSSSSSVTNWLLDGFTYLMLTLASTSAVSVLLFGLQGTVKQQEKLANDLKIGQAELEERILERTNELEHRATLLEIATNVSRAIAQLKEPQILLQTTVDLLRTEFNFYYAAVFLLDEKMEYAVLKAGTGDQGQAMIAKNHRLRSGEEGIVGYVVSRGEPRIALDVGKDAVHFKNPYLPDTRSEMALPIIVQGKVLGALDVQSIQEAAFKEEDIRILQTVADQVGSMLTLNQRISQLDYRINELEAGIQRTTGENWGVFLASQEKSLQYTIKDGTIKNESKMNPEMEKAFRTGSTVVTQSANIERQKTMVAVPIKLRDQTLGVVNIALNTKLPSNELVELVEATSSRMALALENARLLEQIQNRAEQTQMVSEITARVRATSEIDEILRTTALEIGKNLGISEVRIQLTPEDQA